VKLRKVISGGQTGADHTALLCAQALGLETGGTCPKGCWTEDGPNRSLVTAFGLVESDSADYPPRTRANVRDSDATVWFGRTSSAGYRCTAKACKAYGKQIVRNPDDDGFRALADAVETLNVAGNRESTNPSVVLRVIAAFQALLE
jgi:hypothetical protein